MKKYLGHFFICLVVFAGLSASMSVGLFSGLENFLEDRLFFNKPVNPDILIVAIDNESIERFGQWPWPRSVFAEFFSKLNKYQPAVVGLDVLFSEPSRQGAVDDLSLFKSLEGLSYPVVFPVEFQNDKEILPIALLRSKVILGFVNLIIDQDGLVRKFPISIGEHRPFGYRIANIVRGEMLRSPGIKKINRIVYAGPPGSFQQVSFRQVIEEDLNNQLRGKIILVGVTTPDLHDDKPTPVSSGQNMTGVEIQANIVNMLLSNYQLIPISPFYSYSWLLLTAFLPLLIIFYSQTLWKLSLFNAGAGFAYLILQIWLFSQGLAINIIHIQLAWIIASMTLIAYQYFVIGREKNELRKVFAKYVSSQVLNEILSDPNKLQLGGERRKITILFSDIRGFTSLSEGLTPEELMHIINEYFSEMADAIMEKEGLVDKYIGDAIMAFWGAPLASVNQAQLACAAAVAMIRRLENLNKHWQEAGLKSLSIGIGINTGEAVVGNMGSKDRWNYSALGDEVNLASRLEGLNKVYGVECIISESTKNELGDSDSIIRELDLVTVKGKKEPTRLYEIICRPLNDKLNEILKLFAEGRAFYEQGKWSAAINKFFAVLTIGEDGPSRVFLERCHELQKKMPNPSSGEWNGVYEFHTK